MTPCPHLCSTEPGTTAKGKSYTGLGKKSRLMKTVQTMKGYNNYQDCSALRPHVPHSSYGTYVTLAPKVLVFPVFVQVSLWHAPGFPQEAVSTGSDLDSRTKGGASPRIQGPSGGRKMTSYCGDYQGSRSLQKKCRKPWSHARVLSFLTQPSSSGAGKVFRHTSGQQSLCGNHVHLPFLFSLLCFSPSFFPASCQ